MSYKREKVVITSWSGSQPVVGQSVTSALVWIRNYRCSPDCRSEFDGLKKPQHRDVILLVTKHTVSLRIFQLKYSLPLQTQRVGHMVITVQTRSWAEKSSNDITVPEP
jgi:hypothetical protein